MARAIRSSDTLTRPTSLAQQSALLPLLPPLLPLPPSLPPRLASRFWVFQKSSIQRALPRESSQPPRPLGGGGWARRDFGNTPREVNSPEEGQKSPPGRPVSRQEEAGGVPWDSEETFQESPLLPDKEGWRACKGGPRRVSNFTHPAVEERGCVFRSRPQFYCL